MDIPGLADSSFDPTMYSDGTNRRRRRVAPPPPPVQPAPPPATKSKLGLLLEAERARQIAEKSGPLPEMDPSRFDEVNPAMQPTAPVPYPGVMSEDEMAGSTRGYRTFNQTPGATPTDRLALLREADPESKVQRGPSGNWEVGAPKKPSRLIRALEGALTGGAIAAASGPTEGAALRFLGGGGTGAVAGGVKPRLVSQFNRQQEINQLEGDTKTDQEIALRQAQIADVGSRPELAGSRILNQIYAERERQRDREADNARQDRAQKTAEGRATEDVRHHGVMEKKPGAKRNPVSLGGQFWEEDDNGVMRVKKGSPPPTPSAAADRRTVRSEAKEAKGKQAASLYQKGSDYWDQAQAKRAEADTINTKKFQTDAEKTKVRALIREAEGLESKTREVQIQGDKLAAESESEPAETTQSTGGGKVFDMTAWKRDHPDATPDEIEAKRRKYSGRIRE